MGRLSTTRAAGNQWFDTVWWPISMQSDIIIKQEFWCFYNSRYMVEYSDKSRYIVWERSPNKYGNVWYITEGTIYQQMAYTHKVLQPHLRWFPNCNVTITNIEYSTKTSEVKVYIITGSELQNMTISLREKVKYTMFRFFFIEPYNRISYEILLVQKIQVKNWIKRKI